MVVPQHRGATPEESHQADAHPELRELVSHGADNLAEQALLQVVIEKKYTVAARVDGRLNVCGSLLRRLDVYHCVEMVRKLSRKTNRLREKL